MELSPELQKEIHEAVYAVCHANDIFRFRTSTGCLVDAKYFTGKPLDDEAHGAVSVSAQCAPCLNVVHELEIFMLETLGFGRDELEWHGVGIFRYANGVEHFTIRYEIITAELQERIKAMPLGPLCREGVGKAPPRDGQYTSLYNKQAKPKPGRKRRAKGAGA